MNQLSHPGRLVATAAFGLLALLLLVGGAVASSGSGAATAKPPTNRHAPSIDGIPKVGKVLRATNGRWRNASSGLVFAYRWQTCANSACTDVAGANDRIYTVRVGDTGKTIVVVVTAANNDGASRAPSKATPAVTAQTKGAPAAQTRPTISGKTELGSTLTAQSGTWQGDPPLEFEYRWRRCTPLGGACEELAQTKQTYTLGAKDEGRTLRVLVSAKNSVGAGASLSDASPLVPGSTVATPPVNTSPPLISGVAAEKRTLTSSSGSWSGTTPMQFSFQWRRCNRSGDDCSSIPNATQQTYTLAGSDVGRTIRVRVVARNAAGSSSANSDKTAVVTGATAPVNTQVPTIAGTAREGSVLTATSGSWQGSRPITFAFQWLRCGTGGGGCGAIQSATARTRALTAADVAKTLRIRVTATNSGGSSVVLSQASAVVAKSGDAPANRAAPVLSGSARQGAKLSVSTGSWHGTQPISFSYRWERCDGAVANCRKVDGATANTYLLARADVGYRLRGVVTARNATGSSSAPSNATAVVVGAPVNTTSPKVTGTPVEGQALIVTTGKWTGAGPITYGYQWTRCNAQGAFSSCVPIVVTSRPTYTLRAADVGRRVFAQVKARNAYGASFVNSDLTGVVAPASIGTITLRAARGVIVFGTPVTLVGRVVGAPAGEQVTLVEHPARGAVRVRPGAAVVGPAGTWSFVVRPSLGTTYEAQFRGGTSGPVLVQVRPRLLLRKAGTARVSLRVFAGRSLAGKTAFLQRWNAQQAPVGHDPASPAEAEPVEQRGGRVSSHAQAARNICALRATWPPGGSRLRDGDEQPRPQMNSSARTGRFRTANVCTRAGCAHGSRPVEATFDFEGGFPVVRSSAAGHEPKRRSTFRALLARSRCWPKKVLVVGHQAGSSSEPLRVVPSC